MGKQSISPAVGVLIGFLIYELSGMFYFSYLLFLLKCIGCVVIAFYYFQTARTKASSISQSYLLLLLCISLILVRGNLIGRPDYSQDGFATYGLYNIARNLFLNPHSALAFTLPFMAMLPFCVDLLTSIRKIGWLILIVWIVSFYINRETIALSNMGSTNIIVNGDYVSIRNLVGSLFVGRGIIVLLLFCIGYIKSKWKWIIPLAYFTLFVLTGTGGGRGGTLTILGTILTAAFIWYKWPVNAGYAKSSKKILMIILIAAMVFGLYYMIMESEYFSFFRLRFFEDDSNTTLRESSREGYVDAFINDFNNHPLAWIFGRGINGWYELPNGKYRCGIEWGYIHLIIKGGIIYLFLYCYVLLKAAYEGIKHSSNTLSKGMSFMCVWQVLSLIPFGVPTVDTQQFFVWFFVGLLMNPQIRNMTNDEVKNLFYSRC